MISPREGLRRFRAAADQSVDGASLAFFRIIFGLMMALSGLRFLLKGWVHEFYVVPKLFFPFLPFDWLQPLPYAGMLAVFALWITAALLIACGLFYRPAVLLFSLAFLYVEALDKTNYLNHYYFVSLMALLLLFVPANRTWSLDVIWGRVTAAPAKRGYLWLLQFQMAVLYVFAGFAKLDGDWLLRAEPLATWLRVRADVPLLGPLFAYHETALLMSWAGMLYDLSIPFFLLWPRTRVPAYLTVLFFHGMTALLFPIGVFPWVMIVCTTVFFAPDWPRRLLCRAGLAGPAPPLQALPATRPALLVLVGLFVVWQILLPLRFLAYPGNVLWHEQGFRFAWRVMLVEKTGHAEYRVVAADGQTYRVWPRDWLTPQQEKMAATQPDMILQFAHHMADVYRAKLGGDVAVYADVWVSLNGRRAHRLVDPTVDLSRQHDGWSAKSWILPAPVDAVAKPPTQATP